MQSQSGRPLRSPWLRNYKKIHQSVTVCLLSLPHTSAPSATSQIMYFSIIYPSLISMSSQKNVPEKVIYTQLLSQQRLEGRRGKEDGLIFVVPLPTVLQSILEELTPLNDAGNIFGHVFSKALNFSMLNWLFLSSCLCSDTTEKGDFPAASL